VRILLRKAAIAEMGVYWRIKEENWDRADKLCRGGFEIRNAEHIAIKLVRQGKKNMF